MSQQLQMPAAGTGQQLKSRILKWFRLLLVAALWILPAWAVWLVASRPEWQAGLRGWQIEVLLWYPIIAVLMLFFLIVLARRLPQDWIGMTFYVVGTLGMAAFHWYLSGTESFTLLMIEWATFSLTLFAVGFSLELFRRIAQTAIAGQWVVAVFGGLAAILVFVIPGLMISASLYLVLYHQGIFTGELLLQVPYLLGLSAAIWHDWRSFRSI